MASKNKQPGVTTVVEIVRGEKLTLPHGMTYDQGIEWLQRRRDEEEEAVAPDRKFAFLWTEGIVALEKALERLYGWTVAKVRMGMFGKMPADVRSVYVGYGQTVEVTASPIEIPNADGFQVAGGFTNKNGRPCFRLFAHMKRKHQEEFKRLGDEIARIVAEESIYKGKAIEFPMTLWDPDDGEPEEHHFPKFLSLPEVHESQVLLNTDCAEDLKDSVLGYLRHSKQLRAAGCNSKIGVLMEGPYGCGKTLTMGLVAHECSLSGRTFVKVPEAVVLAHAYDFAAQYAPAVVAVEDVDRALNGPRTSFTDQILNIVDGVEHKNKELMLLCTTNDVEAIPKAMLRPGRFDVVLSIQAPDPETVERLVRYYAGELLPEGEDLYYVGQVLAGQIPATVREVVEKAKRGAVRRTAEDGLPFALAATDLERSARRMLRHLELLREKAQDTRGPLERAAQVLVDGARGIVKANGRSEPTGKATALEPLPDDVVRSLYEPY